MGKRKRDKRPVLTSPWKIGTMVALMLVATSFGVGYYMVRVYDIDLYWLSSDVSRWVVDSYQFFREIYPAAAGVILLSLFTYFVIATAVRRYKYYLNSGQDYRKMISLAKSIDDLTNPAQIARLSDYPRLQKVLRNYGDQIREISEDIESREVEMSSVDFEMEIDSILEGNGLNETIAEGKWWVSIAKKVQCWADENVGGTEEIRKQSEAARQKAGRASLSCGKIVETVAGASEDILDIVKSAGELNEVAEGLGSNGSGTVADAGSPSDAIAAVETAAAALEERSSVIHDLSEEGNGLALNIALMAARGEATEKDLALLAEKVRSTAERFGKLGRELEGLVRTVASSSRNARSSAGGSVAADSGTSPEVERRIIEISTKIESRSQALQQKIMALGSDVEEINEELQADKDGDDRIRATDGSIVNFGAGADESAEESDGIDDSDLVIDHGTVWKGSETAPENGMEAEGDASAPSDDVIEEDVTDDSDEALSGFQEAMSAMLSDADQPQVDEVSAEEVASEEAEIPEETSEEAEEEVQAEEAPDMVDELFADDPVAEVEQEASPQQETVVEADLSADENWDNMQEQTDDWVKVEVEPVVDNAHVDEIEPEVVPDPDEESVHDLFELGAVEYVEETEVNL